MNQKRKNNGTIRNADFFSKGYKLIKPLQKKSGFTMIELMIVIAIILILSSLAMYGWNRLIPRFQTKSTAIQLKSDLQFAKLEAIKQNRTCLVDFTVTGAAIPVPGGSCITCFDTTGDNSCADEAAADIITQLNLTASGNVTISNTNFAGHRFSFNSRGIPTASGTVVINCVPDASYSLSLILLWGGRLRIN